MQYMANRRYVYQWDPRFMTQGIQVNGWPLRTATRNDGKLAHTDHMTIRAIFMSNVRCVADHFDTVVD
jgi:hypothetical protein